MLRKLTLDGVGPSKSLKVEFAERLNLITGDNGLGKSFLLDVAWWALTRTWPRANAQAVPRTDVNSATIRTWVTGGNEEGQPSDFDFRKQSWRQYAEAPPRPSLVLYAQVDGGFSVWDSTRNYARGEQPRAYMFDSRQIWAGLLEDGHWRCNGLNRDWVSCNCKAMACSTNYPRRSRNSPLPARA